MLHKYIIYKNEREIAFRNTNVLCILYKYIFYVCVKTNKPLNRVKTMSSNSMNYKWETLVLNNLYPKWIVFNSRYQFEFEFKINNMVRHIDMEFSIHYMVFCFVLRCVCFITIILNSVKWLFRRFLLKLNGL